MSASPPCGPAAVTSVPATHSSDQHADGGPGQHAAAERGTVGCGGPSPSFSRTSSTIAQNSSTSETSMCGATVHQASSNRTTTPPQIGLEQHAGRADRGDRQQAAALRPGQPHGQERAERGDQHDAGERAVTELDRLVERGHALALTPGPASPGWHSGQVGQPRPEPVTRTVAPVTAMPPLASTAAQANARCTRCEGRPGATRDACSAHGRRADGSVADRSLPSEPPYGADPAEHRPAARARRGTMVPAPVRTAAPPAAPRTGRPPASPRRPPAASPAPLVSGTRTPPIEHHDEPQHVRQTEHGLGPQGPAEQQRRDR